MSTQSSRIIKFQFKDCMEDLHLKLPVGSEVVKAAMQRELVTVWIQTPLNKPEYLAKNLSPQIIDRIGMIHLRVVPTGLEFGDSYEYVDTVFDRQFVWHVLRLIS